MHLDEPERGLARRWAPLEQYIAVFEKQELAFAALIEGLREDELCGPGGCQRNAPADAATVAAAVDSQRESMRYEAQEAFLALDELNRAVKLKNADAAEKGHVRLAISYDRFLKAALLYDAYDLFATRDDFLAAARERHARAAQRRRR